MKTTTRQFSESISRNLRECDAVRPKLVKCIFGIFDGMFGFVKVQQFI